jgi:hypothetical protein
VTAVAVLGDPAAVALATDIVFARGLRPVTDVPVGTDDVKPSGRYPSDHAGVVARLAPKGGQ